MGDVAGVLTSFCAENFAHANLARRGVLDIIDASGVDEEY
jgi:hypothetical protein